MLLRRDEDGHDGLLCVTKHKKLQYAMTWLRWESGIRYVLSIGWLRHEKEKTDTP